MKRKSFLLSAALLLALSMILAACGGNSDEGGSDNGGEGGSEKPKFLSIVTGGTGGTYFPLGGAFADIISDETGIQANAETSGASAENMNTLKDGNAEIAFSQTDIASYAKDGKLMFEGSAVDNVSAIGTLYPETIQIVTTAKSGIKSVEDLKGKKVSVGAPGSGTNPNAEQILEVHGMTFDDIDKQDLSFDESTAGIQDGTIDAAFVTAGTPTGAVEGLSATEEVVIVPIEQDKIDALIEKYPYYIQDEVPSGTYGLSDAVATVAVQAMLVVANDLSEDTVYDITKAIFENTDKITHAKGKLITAESALNGVGIDVHPGAQKYFDEKGVKAE
ncbi:MULTISPECIES: TAXI family TRAP transporter solute-binding subunit [Bacillaceae]|uniref:Immunogenic protein n=2 Tax=Bacillus infantis TaxID=324767 RepID=U5L7V2_9BACI|nr:MULTISPECIES: TAXI family TRAP transporter solute-binding subunit [Bacillus]OXT17305.1 C4-dicarboxylate ABC transporter substrate-binding protein [Bacillus sp. OG2]AGX03510.1 immunogenic protein [Bacillus infantis NRRL B-14911]EAR64615.1 immunogenic protein [Bacillus sp. NRRL B-14911]MCA1034354.1 TAXI family TRAP transporter solute-binding subunit [Bacillus infantis]MCK6204200.1 TAXI family TRAP transporter solute-binding subunit [Bacillus infantis]